jgi:hypothetical protein
MILEMIMTVCLLAEPKACHDERFKFVDPKISLLECMMGTAIMAEIMEWRRKHPEYRIDGWSCREHKPEKDI